MFLTSHMTGKHFFTLAMINWEPDLLMLRMKVDWKSLMPCLQGP